MVGISQNIGRYRFVITGAFVLEYVGEVLTAKEGDKRGRIYDKIGMSYLFDMNEPDETDDYDM